jgi:hypothetical protein
MRLTNCFATNCREEDELLIAASSCRRQVGMRRHRVAPKRARSFSGKTWARQDSNLGPRDYESPALTAELQAHFLQVEDYRVSNREPTAKAFGAALTPN